MDSFASAISDPTTGLTLSPVQRMQHLFEANELADKVGLDVFSIGEHHRAEFLDSAPVVFLSAAATRTAAAVAALQFGSFLNVSEDGRLSFYRSGDLKIQPKLNALPLLSWPRQCFAASLQFSGDLYLAATHLHCPFPR